MSNARVFSRDSWIHVTSRYSIAFALMKVTSGRELHTRIYVFCKFCFADSLYVKQNDVECSRKIWTLCPLRPPLSTLTRLTGLHESLLGAVFACGTVVFEAITPASGVSHDVARAFFCYRGPLGGQGGGGGCVCVCGNRSGFGSENERERGREMKKREKRRKLNGLTLIA